MLVLYNELCLLNISIPTVSFSSLGTPLRWMMANCTPFGKSLNYLSKSALKMVEVRVDGNESVVSCCIDIEQTYMCASAFVKISCQCAKVELAI